MNQVILIGLLDGMPRYKPTSRGDLLTFTLRVPRRNSEATDEVDVICWQAPPDFEFEMHRDRRVKIVGEIRTNRFKLAGRETKSTTVVASGIKFLGDRDENQVPAIASGGR